MNDQIRWAAQDVDDAIAAIAECDRLIASYEAEASKVAYDPGAHAAMTCWAERHRADKRYWQDRLPSLRHRLMIVGG